MKRLATILLLTLGTASLCAQPAPALTVDDCLNLALEQHPALASAQAGVAAANEAVGEARTPFYPRVDLTAGYHRFQRRAYLPGAITLPGGAQPKLIGPLDDWNGGLVSRVTLFDFGARQAGLAAAEARRSGADAGVAATRANLRATVQAAFHALAIAQDLQQVAAKNLERAEQHHRLADLRQQAGAVPQADVLRTAATEAEARLQLITAESRVRRAAGELNTAMGRAADTALTIAQTETLTPPAPVDYTAAVEQALARRPELLASNQRTVAAQAAVTAAKAARAPRLNADASFGWRDSAWVPETREWQAGLTIDLPLFDAGGRKRGVARARAEVAREEATDANLRLQVRQEVWSAQVELERAWAAIAANEAGVRAAAESLRAVRERYEFGAAIITDLLDTQTALARTEASLAEAKGQYRTARVYFERAVGTGEKPDGKL